MQPITAIGRWWLPESPDQKVHGPLRIDTKGRSELELSGVLRSFVEGGETTINADTGRTITEFSKESLARSRVYSRIVGLADGKRFTLDDCIQTAQRHNFFGGGRSRERIMSNQVFRGIEFDAGEAVEFCEANMTLQWLPYWVRSSGLEETLTL